MNCLNELFKLCELLEVAELNVQCELTFGIRVSEILQLLKA